MHLYRKLLQLLIQSILIVTLTIITQIGGVLYFVSFLIFSSHKKIGKRVLFFSSLYLLMTFLITPKLAKQFGRIKIKHSTCLKPKSLFYTLTNRDYVRPELHDAIHNIAKQLQKKHPTCQLIYLDANFPFFNQFPLLPHLSHNDGKKIDIAFIYTTNNGSLTNKKPTRTGYGFYTPPLKGEPNQIKQCKALGNWQYDFPKYLTLGKIHPTLSFSKQLNQDLGKLLIAEPAIQKIFIEPHLKQRLNLNHGKVRFHGCQSVRHDDHFHIQL